MLNNKEKTYWPHMILGFLALGITLSYWTVKSASSLPVQESNQYMLKYQQADMSINEIIKKQQLFDKDFSIVMLNAKTIMLDIDNAKRTKKEKSVVLKRGKNTFSYRIMSKNDILPNDVNVTFLLTRPHSISEDILVKDISQINGEYIIRDINISKAGRYILQLRAKVGEAIGYSEIPAYLKP